MGNENRDFRQRKGEILFMDLRQMGEPFEKKFTQFSIDDIQQVAATYHDWQTSTLENVSEAFKQEEYCYSASREEVEAKDFSLVPSKYIAFKNRDENINFDEKMKTLQAEFRELLQAEEKSKKELLNVFKNLGYEL